MKLAITLFLIFGGIQAYAKTQFCLAGQVDATGLVKSMSGNETQVIVLRDGVISAHTLTNPFILFNNKFHINTPFDMTWVKNMGKCGSYNESTNIAANWQVNTDGTVRTTIDFKADTEALKGNADTEKYFEANGNWAGSATDDMICSNAGLKNGSVFCN